MGRIASPVLTLAVTLATVVATGPAAPARDAHARRAAAPRPSTQILYEASRCRTVRDRAEQDCSVHLWTVDVATRLRRHLTRGTEAVWSPDGRRVAFRDGSGISTIRADGSARRRVARIGGTIFSLSWAPDGGRIAFAVGRTIGVVNADGSGRRTLARASEWVWALAWSPVGDELAYSTVDFATSPSEVYLLTVGGRPRYVAQGGSPVWSPDGSQIAYEVGRQGELGAHLGVDLVRADGSDRRTLALAEAPDRSPTWSPSAHEVAFIRNEYILYRARDDGTRLHRVALGAIDDPAWSPGGARIAYVGDDYAIYVVRPDGTGRERVAPRGWNPQWRPRVRP